MKSIIVAHVILIAVCAWGEVDDSMSQAQIVRPPIQYCIEEVQFTKDEIEASNSSHGNALGSLSEKSEDNERVNRKGSRSKTNMYINGEGTFGATMTPTGPKPTGNAKITGGGGYEKQWETVNQEENRNKQSFSRSESSGQEWHQDYKMGDWKLTTKIKIRNISPNQTYEYISNGNSDSGLDVCSSDKSVQLTIPLTLQKAIKLAPNAEDSINVITVIVDTYQKKWLRDWSEQRILKDKLMLEVDDEFCFGFEDETGSHRWSPSCVPYSVAVNACFSDVSPIYRDKFPIYISGKGLTWGAVLDKVSEEVAKNEAEDHKFEFGDNGFLSRGFGLSFGAFTNDADSVYALMAEVNGKLRSSLVKDERLSCDYDNERSELRFVKIGTEDLLSGYLRSKAHRPKEIIADCLSYMECALTNSVVLSCKDLRNGAELAREEKDYLRYAHFLSSMSDESRDQFLKSAEAKQSAIELAIMADNAEYFSKLYSLGWGNTNRTILGFAAEEGKLNIVKWFLEKAPDNERLKNGKLKVDDLVAGADDDDVGERGKTPLYWAAKNGHLKVCQYLASKGADVNRVFYEKEKKSGKVREYDELVKLSYISDACITNYINAQREVLKFRNMWRPREGAFKEGITADKIKSWVCAGVLPDSPNCDLGYNWNFLSWAIFLEDVSLVDFLIDNGADVNSATPDDNFTALMLACEAGDTNLVAKLIAKNADVYAHQENGMNAFYYAIKNRKYDCAEILLDKLDPAKCSLVEDDDKKLNLFEYVGKYCESRELCETVKARYSDAWLNMLASLYGTGFRECLDRCGLSDDEAKKLLEMYPSVQMSDDLYDKGHFRAYLAKMPEGKREYLQERNPLLIDCFYFLELREKAEQGDVESLYELGKRYGQGDGVDKDLTKAFNNFCKAAEGEGGHAKACYNLSVCYSKGLGTPKDEVLAKRWKQEAVNRGFEK